MIEHTLGELFIIGIFIEYVTYRSCNYHDEKI